MRHILTFGLVAMLAGCTPMPPDRVTQSTSVTVWIDPMTGCHYVHRLNGGITPRLSSDGTQICNAEPTQ